MQSHGDSSRQEQPNTQGLTGALYIESQIHQREFWAVRHLSATSSVSFHLHLKNFFCPQALSLALLKSCCLLPLFMHSSGYQSLASANVIAAVAKIALNSALQQTVINIFALFYSGQRGGGSALQFVPVRLTNAGLLNMNDFKFVDYKSLDRLCWVIWWLKLAAYE